MALHIQFESEWDDLAELLEEFGALRREQRFSPTCARSFASALIVSTTLDEARGHMQRDPAAAAHFSVAAHFAVGFVRGGTPVIGSKEPSQTEPFLLVASAVLNLLDALAEHYS